MPGSDEEKRSWLVRVLGIGAVPSNGDGQDGNAEDLLDLKARLADATRKLIAMKAEGDPALPTVMTAHGLASAAYTSKAPNAGALMNELEAALALALSAARGRQAASENKGVVEYAKLLLRWHVAQERVLTGLNDLGAALLAADNMADREDYAEIVDAVYELPELIPDFGYELDSVLEAARRPGADRASLNQDALEIIADYRSEIEAVSELKALQEFSTALPTGKVDLFDELKAALDQIEAEVSKVA